MPVSVTYPGVFIEGTPNGKPVVTPVPTGIAAFVGRTVSGPENQPTTCFSYCDFEKLFGGRDPGFPLSDAVEDFFRNGGAQAVIVRVTASAAGAAPARSVLPGATPMGLQAANSGRWGNRLTATVDKTGITEAMATHNGSTVANSFNLTLTLKKADGTAVSERYEAINIDNTSHRLDRILMQLSYLAIASSTPVGVPDVTTAPVVFSGGADSQHLSDADIIGDQAAHTGLYALEKSDLFNLLCIPWDRRGVDISPVVHAAAAGYCVSRRAVYIADGPESWLQSLVSSHINPGADLGITDAAAQRNCAVYFPKIKKSSTAAAGQGDVFPACGVVAGQIARTDRLQGVWKAPAGIDTGLIGVTGLEIDLKDAEQGSLNALGVNCLRNFRVTGPVIWGARTLRGADLTSDDYKYLPTRRLTLYIEECLYRGTKFAVFEPNAEPLWAQLRLAIGAFMDGLQKAGAFYSYSVKCDATTTTQYDIGRGICNCVIAFAPEKPGEFIILQIAQTAGQGG